MADLNFPATIDRRAHIAHREIVAAFAGAMRALVRLLSRVRARDQDWSSLSPHLIADIGETPASAQAEALRAVFYPPLGSIGLGEPVETGRWPPVSRPTSPLGGAPDPATLAKLL